MVIPFSGDLAQLADRIHPSTQTVGIYPESLKEPLRDVLVARGVCRFISIGHTIDYSIGGPFNSYEIMRRACRWILDESISIQMVSAVVLYAQSLADPQTSHFLGDSTS